MCSLIHTHTHHLFLRPAPDNLHLRCSYHLHSSHSLLSTWGVVMLETKTKNKQKKNAVSNPGPKVYIICACWMAVPCALSVILISSQSKLFCRSITPYSVFYSVPSLRVIPDMILSKQVPSEDRESIRCLPYTILGEPKMI